ncbi:tRNA lysidine(34) synthetase TilS [Merismopedia glauca]|uniref:tRNA lysidine(34) synthetase TilS n=1 Tax=Merismopedia glauca TaxID=292586 RepID=UPI003BB49E43
MSWTPLHHRLHQTLHHRELLPKSASVLIAVSGGQDSLCLGQLLRDLQPKWDWNLAIAHCDHNWTLDAGLAEHVEAIAQSWNLPYYFQLAVNLKETEGAARTWRYQVLTQMAQENGFEIVVTGHTQSDRAETLLYNLVRGAGSNGLTALGWSRPLTANIALVRPLLNVTRQETAQFCQERNLPIWDDPYNKKLKYARNRIRQELIPYLETHFHPQAAKSLAKTAEILRAEAEYLQEVSEHWYKEAVSQSSTGNYQLDRTVVRHIPLALQRRVIQQLIRQSLNHSPNFEQIEELVGLLTAPNRSQSQPLVRGAIALVSGNYLILQIKMDA